MLAHAAADLDPSTSGRRLRGLRTAGGLSELGPEVSPGDQCPVVANQALPRLMTKMIGARHGCGNTKSASILASPPPFDAGPTVAGN